MLLFASASPSQLQPEQNAETKSLARVGVLTATMSGNMFSLVKVLWKAAKRYCVCVCAARQPCFFIYARECGCVSVACAMNDIYYLLSFIEHSFVARNGCGVRA